MIIATHVGLLFRSEATGRPRFVPWHQIKRLDFEPNVAIVVGFVDGKFDRALGTSEDDLYDVVGEICNPSVAALAAQTQKKYGKG